MGKFFWWLFAFIGVTNVIIEILVQISDNEKNK